METKDPSQEVLVRTQGICNHYTGRTTVVSHLLCKTAIDREMDCPETNQSLEPKVVQAHYKGQNTNYYCQEKCKAVALLLHNRAKDRGTPWWAL